MDTWASKPLVCPLSLRLDDGKRPPKHSKSQRFGRALRERFSMAGLAKLGHRAAHLPSDLKWIAMVVPLVIGIWVLARPTTAEPARMPVPIEKSEAEAPPLEEERTQVAALKPVAIPPAPEPVATPEPPVSKTPPPAATPGAPTAWDNFTARIASRASVDLVEDFHNGLSSWEGRGEWARTWSYDRSGTVRPGHMAIYQPTLGLRDYVLEMKASIERRSIQWMVRASNPQNYHLARLNVTPGAPLTRLELERWSVVNGRAGRVTRLPLPHGGANQTVYSIRVEVNGDSVSTYLQDQAIDTFSDSRLAKGGVGLVGSADDRPRIYGIRVFHQNDFLGKLCSFLAPPPINTQGSD